jgi:predicted lipid-binding transport protein (Tim44 family)
LRKLAWLIIILAVLTPTIIACGLAYPPFGDGLRYVFVEIIGVGTANLLVGALTGLFLWGSMNGLQAAAVLVSVWIIGGVMWLVIKKYAWDKRPQILKKVSISSGTATVVREEPRDVIMTETASPTKTKPEELKKEEVAVTESTS